MPLQIALTFRFVLLSLLVCILTSGAVARNAVWNNGVSLYGDVVRKSPKKSRGYDHLGVSFHKRSEYANAIASYEMAIRVDPYLSINPYRNLARLYIDIGQYDRAVQILTWAMSIDASNYELYSTRGMAYQRKKAIPEALADYSRALELDPENRAIYVDRGLAYEEAGDRKAAAGDFEEACRRGHAAACEKVRSLLPGGERQ